MATEESTAAAAATTTTTARTLSRSVAPIYLSYSNQSGFLERYFVVKLHQQLLAHGLGDGVLWFDHEQGIHPDKVTFQESKEISPFSLMYLVSQLAR